MGLFVRIKMVLVATIHSWGGNGSRGKARVDLDRKDESERANCLGAKNIGSASEW